jgi:ABC-type transporter Mla subunit MlaD
MTSDSVQVSHLFDKIDAFVAGLEDQDFDFADIVGALDEYVDVAQDFLA